MLNRVIVEHRPRWALAIVVLLLAAFALAACGGGDDGDDDDGNGNGASTTERAERDATRDGASNGDDADDADSGDADTDGAGSAITVAQEPGLLRIARAEPITLDPALVTDATSASYVVELFSGLVGLNTDLDIIPDLAETIPEPTPNDDGTVTYRFTLRRDALFHNSTRVSAEDVKWSIERHAARETFSPTAPDFLGDIVGARDYIRGRADEITGIVVIDDRTVDITIDESKPYFLLKLTYPTAFVVNRDQVEGDPRNWSRDPIGTGPFTVDQWDLGEQMILTPFDRYHLGAALLDRVQVRFAGGGVTQYENNEVDIAVVGANDIERARDTADPLNAEFVSIPELAISYVGFNTEQPPFDDPLVRQAFAMAVDKETLIDVVLMNSAAVAEGILPPGIPGHDPAFLGLGFDPERAQELLAESTYAGRIPNVRMTISGQGATSGPVIEALQDMWRQHLEIEVEIQQVETATFFSELDRGLYQMFTLGWIGDYPDAENFLDILFHSASLQNNPAYSNPTVDDLLEQARGEQDEARRIELYQQVERIVVDDAPWIPLFFQQANELVKPWVEGYQQPPIVVPYLRLISTG